MISIKHKKFEDLKIEYSYYVDGNINKSQSYLETLKIGLWRFYMMQDIREENMYYREPFEFKDMINIELSLIYNIIIKDTEVKQILSILNINNIKYEIIDYNEYNKSIFIKSIDKENLNKLYNIILCNLKKFIEQNSKK